MAYDKAKKTATYKRYHDKTYTRYSLHLHNSTHKDVIEYFKNEMEQGKSPTQIVVALVNKKLEGE